MPDDPVLKKFPARLGPWLEAHGFRKTEARDYGSMGSAMVVFDADAYRLRFFSDRGEPFADIAGWPEPDRWRDLSLLPSLIEDRPLTEPASPEVLTAFLERRHETLRVLFSEASYPETRARLDRLGRRRSRQLFPGAFDDEG